MKKQTKFAIALIAALGLASTAVLAKEKVENNNQTLIKMTTILENLKSKGYDIVKNIDFDQEKNTYEAKVVNASGKTIKIDIDAKTGKMTKSSNESEGLTALQVAKKVEAAGYPHIYTINIEFFGDKYDVKALDQKGEKVKFDVDAKTGKILN